MFQENPETEFAEGVENRLRGLLASAVEVFGRDRMGQFGAAVVLLFAVLAVVAPFIVPHQPSELVAAPLQEPSADHPFGTTQLGRDVLSQTLVSTRVSLVVGFLSAFMAVFIGTNVALLSGYLGGWVDDVFMRITDIAYGIPFLPFVIILVILLGPDLFNIVLAIALVQWRSSARVIRSQVLSHKERPYVESVRAIGGSDARIMYVHILPNVLPLSFLYGAFAVGWAIIAEASVSFLGYGDPELYSWGKMLYHAYNAGVIRFAWWWVIPPCLGIVLCVMSVFLIGRALEQVTNPELRHQE